MMSGPNGDPSMSIDDGIINDEDEFDNEEYADINSMLDQINSYLDDLEERNDTLNGKMHELLESNRQARLEFRAQLLGSSTQGEHHTEEERRPAEEEPSLPSKEDLNKENGGA
ncbi:bublin coiled-coil protein [Leuresthes tenuis]|uniref:bublin coiled-coil protein n=1 Tax=Leuresthes tenuis TaxID=355514 RepID=UPI003B50A39B